MTTPAAVYDTNIYYRLSEPARFDALLEAERRRGIAPYADPWVLMELLGHLADPADPAVLKRWRRAVWRAYTRCAPHGDGRACGLINDSESQIVRLVTGRPLPGHEEATTNLGNLCAGVASTPLNEPLTAFEPQLRYLADHIARMEQWFADHFRAQRELRDKILAGIRQEHQQATRAAAIREVDSSPTLRAAIAELIVRAAHQDHGLAVPEPLDPNVVLQVYNAIPVGIEFHVQLMKTAIYDGANLDAPEIRNLMWDERIAYDIGQELDGGPIWLITNDHRFATAASAVGFGDRVHTLAEYERWLGSTWEPRQAPVVEHGVMRGPTSAV